MLGSRKLQLGGPSIQIVSIEGDLYNKVNRNQSFVIAIEINESAFSMFSSELAKHKRR